MRLKKFNELNESTGVVAEPGDDESVNFHEEDINDLDIDYDDDDDEDDEDDKTVIDQDALDTLCSTLRKMVKHAGFTENSWVFTDDENCINIQFLFNKTEKMSTLMNAMNFLKKLESDILIQYDSEFDLWETKAGQPLATAKFFYDEGVDKKSVSKEEMFDDTMEPF